MWWLTIIELMFVVLFQGGFACAQGPSRRDTSKAVIEKILDCSGQAQEAVVLSDRVECKDYQKGTDFLAEKSFDMPLKVDSKNACRENSGDWRALGGDTIKALAKQQSVRIDPEGLRIIGAIFCETLDLIGLELTYSLVLDRSIFVNGIQARNFRTHGDFSIEGSLIFGELYLARVHVDGTIFANESLINKVRVLDAEVRGSLLFRNALILELAAFDTVSLSGELSMRDSFFPYLLVQFSKIGGVLDLTDSQARCSYHVRKSEIGDIVAVDSGFGTSEQPPGKSSQRDWLYRWRDQISSAPFEVKEKESRKTKLQDLLEATKRDPFDKAQQAANDTRCDHSVISFSPGSFLIADTQVKSSVCLRSFHWLKGSGSAEPKSFVTFTDVNVSAAASINLETANSDSIGGSSHRLEIIGFQAGSLFFHFNDSGNYPYALLLSGLKFENIYAADNPCGYDPNFSDSDTKRADAMKAANATVSVLENKPVAIPLRQENDPDPGSHFRLPHVQEVMTWLDKNLLATTQPFAAFVDVFQKHGENNDAKSLRIAKATTELCLKASRVFGDWVCRKGKEKIATSQGVGVRSIVDWGNDVVSVSFGAILLVIADDGYHPEKVGWFVVFAIVAFGLYFWLILRTVGLLPKDKHIILPIGIVFLFDRLLPAYQIREDHYHVETFFKRVPKKMRKSQHLEIKTMRYLWRDIPVVATNEVERLRIERSLDVLKIVGLVLAVFLVAAINAIVSR